MNKLTIKRDALIGANGQKDGLMSHLYVSAIAEAFKSDDIEKFLKDIQWEKKQDIECYMVVEGHKIPIDVVCEAWEKQVDRMINERALEIVENKLRKFVDIASDIEKRMKIKVKKELGIELDDYEYEE